MTEIIVAVITGGITLAGTLIGVAWQIQATQDKITHSLDVKQAVTDTKLDELTREVRRHNGFAERIPVVEEQIKAITQRVEALEGQG